MGEGTENVLAQLEAAVAAWNARAGKAHHGVLRAVAEVRSRLNAVARLLDVQRSVSPSLVTARTSLEALEQSPEEGRRSVEKAIASMAELGMYLGTFERALEGLLEQADGAVRSGEQLMEQLLTVRGETAPVLDLDQAELEAYVTGTARVPLPSEREARLQEQVGTLREELAAVREAFADLASQEAETVAAAREELETQRQRMAELQGELEAARRGAGERREPPRKAPPVEVSDGYGRILAHAHDERGVKRRLGQILVDARVITRDQLDEALLARQSVGNRHLGSILVDRGYTTHAMVAQALAAQARVPFIHLRESNIDPRALRAVTPRMARRHTVLPFHVDAEVLSVAMANPLDLIALDDLGLAVRQHVQPYAAALDEIEEAIGRHYRQP